LSINPYLRKIFIVTIIWYLLKTFSPERLYNFYYINVHQLPLPWLPPELMSLIFRLIFGLAILFMVLRLKKNLPSFYAKFKKCTSRKERDIAEIRAMREYILSKSPIRMFNTLFYYSCWGLICTALTFNTDLMVLNFVLCAICLLLYYWHIFNIPFVEFEKIACQVQKKKFVLTNFSNFSLGRFFFRQTLPKRVAGELAQTFGRQLKRGLEVISRSGTPSPGVSRPPTPQFTQISPPPPSEVVINQTQPIPVTIEPPHNTGTNAVFSTIGEKVAEALPYGLGIVAAYTAFKTGEQADVQKEQLEESRKQTACIEKEQKKRTKFMESFQTEVLEEVRELKNENKRLKTQVDEMSDEMSHNENRSLIEKVCGTNKYSGSSGEK
jgi:hypothetical protein